MVRDSPLGVFKTICRLPQMIWAWLWDNQSMPSTISKPANLKGSRDKGKEWFLMDISHPSRTVETVSIVPSANSTSYFMSRVLIGIFSSWQNSWSTKDLSAPESNSTLANILFTRKVPVSTLSSLTASFASKRKILAFDFFVSSAFLAYVGQLLFMCPFSLQLKQVASFIFLHSTVL
ncbi:hypothetical protein HanXRQr2_Chr15g0693251 [Helianthus annuus]|uniref:Uncharacterized protein n=1 Tax=Helianthus annuus TaxID=4232 RepID=A0A9K3E0G2_HELAN|nr:hypothetical protein HanXRQr2_Chr15g0693251 [Helianthus annuus]